MEEDDLIKNRSLDQGDTLLNENYQGKLEKPEKYFLSNKLNTPLKFQLISNLDFIDHHFVFFTFIKYLTGFIFLVVPFLFIIGFITSDYDQKYKYMVLPYFLTIGTLMSSLIILLVIKLTDSCRASGILIPTWERINVYRILRMIGIILIILWNLFLFESFIMNFNVLKEKVAQSHTKQTLSKIFDRGTYAIRIFFILLLWDREKNPITGEYVYEKIGYFEYEGTFFEDFQQALSNLLIPIIALCILTFIKIFFIKTKNGLSYFCLSLIIMINSFIFIYYPTTNEDEINKKNIPENTSYFTNTSIKYIEIVCDFLIILLMLYLSGKIFIINLLKKKYYPYRTKKKIKSIFILVILAFSINVLGYLVFLTLLLMLYFSEINENMSIYRYNLYWILAYISVTLILTGYALPFGNLCLNLIYYPTAYEIYEHELKNDCYKKCSNNLRINSMFHIETQAINQKSIF